MKTVPARGRSARQLVGGGSGKWLFLPVIRSPPNRTCRRALAPHHPNAAPRTRGLFLTPIMAVKSHTRGRVCRLSLGDHSCLGEENQLLPELDCFRAKSTAGDAAAPPPGFGPRVGSVIAIAGPTAGRKLCHVTKPPRSNSRTRRVLKRRSRLGKAATVLRTKATSSRRRVATIRLAVQLAPRPGANRTRSKCSRPPCRRPSHSGRWHGLKGEPSCLRRSSAGQGILPCQPEALGGYRPALGTRLTKLLGALRFE